MVKGNVVVLGGGTGPLCTLKLSEHGYEITIISSVTDDGGSSGDLLKKNSSILPPGDIRRIVSYSSKNPLFGKNLEKRIDHDCPVDSSDLISLIRFYVNEAYSSNSSNLIERFIENGNESALKQNLGIDNLQGHPLGNLILSALMLEYGNTEGVQRLCKMAETDVDVLPASNRNATFCFMTRGMKKPTNGENALDDFQRHAEPIENCWLDKNLEPYRRALERIEDADVVVISPTSLYANIVSILLIPGFAEALKEKKIVWLGNVMTEWNQTAYSEFSLNGIGHLGILKRYMNRYPDLVLIPKLKGQTLGDVFGNYEDEGASPVLYRRRDFEQHGIEYHEEDMINTIEIEHHGKKLTVLRHDSEKVAQYLDEIIQEHL